MFKTKTKLLQNFNETTHWNFPRYLIGFLSLIPYTRAARSEYIRSLRSATYTTKICIIVNLYYCLSIVLYILKSFHYKLQKWLEPFPHKNRIIAQIPHFDNDFISSFISKNYMQRSKLCVIRTKLQCV